MKTAMQELIDWANECLTDITMSDTGRIALEITIVRATCLLEKEKEQIQNVFEHCWNHPYFLGEYDIKDMQEYLKTYNQNK